MSSPPSVERYIAARPSLAERAAFESSPGLLLAWVVAPDGWKSIAAMVIVVAIAVAFGPPVVRSRGNDPIWPVTKRPSELRVTGPGKETPMGVERGGWFIMAAAAVALVGLVVWIVQRESYGLLLLAAALWIVGSLVQALFVHRAESDLIVTR